MKEKEKKVVKAVGCWIILRNIMMWVNILFSLSVIGLGVYKYSDGNFDNFADVFIPFYLIFFGVLLICAEAEWLLLIKSFKFLDNYFGRGFYNIFLGTMLLNIISINYEDGSAERNAVWIIVVIVSSTMALVGILEIFLYFWHCGKKSPKYTKYDDEQAIKEKLIKEEDKLTQQVTQNVRSEIDIKYSQSLQPQNSDIIEQQQQKPTQIAISQEQVEKMQSNPEEYMRWLQTQVAVTQSRLPKNDPNKEL